MTKDLRTHWIVLMAVLFTVASAFAQNAVTNPGFETGTLSPWTVTGNASVQNNGGGTYATPHGGTYFLAFNAGNTTPNGVASQVISTAPGSYQSLTFYHGIFVWNQTATQTVTATVKDANGVTLATQQFSITATAGTTAVTSWSQQDTLNFTARTLQTTIQFTDVGTTTTNTDLLLDDVSVTQVPLVGSDSPTGPVGGIYTANAQRTVVDLTVTGATGAYPLQWSRTYNSRGAIGSRLGSGTSWLHSYAWTIDSGSLVGGTIIPNQPDFYVVGYPDGRQITFVPSTKRDANGVLDTNYMALGPGISDRFQPVAGSHECFLLLADGGKIGFYQELYENNVDYWPLEIIDPNGLSTAVNTDLDHVVTQITEPAGRWLKLTYDTNKVHITRVDAGYTIGSTDTITQTVSYTYGTFTSNGYNYDVLTGASYDNGTNGGATYTYAAPNVGSYGILLRTADDVRAAGLKRIGYSYATGTGVAFGQLASENYYAGGVLQANPTPAPTPVSTLTVSGNTRTITRGDTVNGSHPSQTFTYGTTTQTGFSVPQGYLLGDATDFLGNHTYFSYDANSYLNKVKDARGNVSSSTNLAFTGATSVATHADNSTVQYFYTDASTGYYLDHVIDELGHKPVQYTRDANHRVTQVTYPDGGVETWGNFTLRNKPQTHTTLAGGTYQYLYDGRELLQTVTDPSLNVTHYTYDANDHLKTVQDPRLNTTTYTYDTFGRLTNLQHPSPQSSSVTWNYNTDSTLHYVQDELGHQTTYAYDDYKRLTSVTTPARGNGDPNGTPTTYFWYDTNGTGATDYTHTDSNVTKLVLASGKVVKALYDADLRKQTVTTACGTTDAATTSFTYNELGQIKTVTGPNGQPGGINAGAVWTYNYDDSRNRLTSVDDPISTDRIGSAPNNHTTMWTYDAASNVLTTTRTNGQVITNNLFDQMNRVLQRTVQQSPSPDAVSKWSYYPSGLLHTYQDPKLVADNLGDSYTYAYDTTGRFVSKQYPLDASGVHKIETVTLYDADSNVSTYKNRAGNTVSFTYDERNRPTLAHWDDGVTPDVSTVYDTASRVTSVNNANANVTRTYYNDNLPYTETIAPFPSPSPAPASHTVTYTYDADGNRASIAYPGSAGVFTYAYTGRNQLDNIHDASSAQWVNYDYDPSGNRTHRKLNGAITDTVYGAADALNRISSISTAFTSGGTATFNYGFDIVSRLKYEQRNGATADGYGYDLANQIVAFNRDGTLSGGNVTGGSEVMSLTFDANGNRTHTVDNGTNANYVLDALNQYTTDSNGPATYDTKGNLATTADGWTYTYDAFNRLTKADNNAPITHIVNYYDGMNRQVARDENGTRTYSEWDGWSLIQEYNSSGTLLNNYLHGAGADEMVARWSTGTSGSNLVANPSFDTADVNGSHLTPWTSTGGTGNSPQNYTPGHTGSWMFAFNGGQAAPGGTLSQSIATTPGTTYTLSFWHGVEAYNQSNVIQKINVYAKAGATTLASQSDNTDSVTAGASVTVNWYSHSLTFTATSSTTTIEFDDVATNPTFNTDSLVDDVSVTANNSNRVWFYQDGRGNTSHLADDTGALIERNTYDLGGKPYFWNASGGSVSASVSNNRFLYNGRDYSSLTKLYDFRNRFYRFDTSRFLQSDPIGHAGGSNMYAFAGNSAANGMDPLGLQAETKSDNPNVGESAGTDGPLPPSTPEPPPSCDASNSTDVSGNTDSAFNSGTLSNSSGSSDGGLIDYPAASSQGVPITPLGSIATSGGGVPGLGAGITAGDAGTVIYGSRSIGVGGLGCAWAPIYQYKAGNFGRSVHIPDLTGNFGPPNSAWYAYGQYKSGNFGSVPYSLNGTIGTSIFILSAFVGPAEVEVDAAYLTSGFKGIVKSGEVIDSAPIESLFNHEFLAGRAGVLGEVPAGGVAGVLTDGAEAFTAFSDGGMIGSANFNPTLSLEAQNAVRLFMERRYPGWR
jgi:RHS repeat-associated protein